MYIIHLVQSTLCIYAILPFKLSQVVSRLHATVLGKSCKRPALRYHKVSSFSFCFDSYLEFQDPNLRILFFLKLLAGTSTGF